MPLLSSKSQPRRIIGIDYGMVRLGIAISDESKTIATPIKVFLADKKTEQTVIKLLEELTRHQKDYHYTIESIVIGLPLMMSGKIGFLADEVKHFTALLQQHTSIPIVFWDERLTSVQADRSMREGNLTRKRRARSADTVAAVIILQNYLDSLKFQEMQLRKETDISNQ
jgi:putative Holliday junction resolvase